MIQSLIDDFNKNIFSQFTDRNDPGYIRLASQYLREVLETYKELAERTRDTTDDSYLKVPFDKSCDALNVIIFNHLAPSLIDDLINEPEENKADLLIHIHEKHETFTV
jgi:hypothetical protein